MPSSIDIDRLPYLTVRIEGHLADGSSSVGTAFLTRLDDDGFPEPQLALITNKHVVAGVQRARLVLHEAHPTDEGKASGSHLHLDVEDFDSNWIPHPNDSIDLCICPLGRLTAKLKGQDKRALTAFVVADHIPSESELQALSVVEDVLMVGYPVDLWCEVANLPVIRRGVTSIHPAVDFRDEPISLIDIACFPGSSGSPVFAMSQVNFAEGRLVASQRKLTFLGVLFAGPTVDVRGEIVCTPIPTTKRFTVSSQIMIHMGYIVKAREVLALMNVLKSLLLHSIEEGRPRGA